MQEFSTTLNIDNGNRYDWGQTSEDYARFRDIYPDSLFTKLHALDIGKFGQVIVDLGTGTGAVPRYLARYGAKFHGIDISAEQIAQAKKLDTDSKYGIDWTVAPAENTGLPTGMADVVMACQCFVYFDKQKVIPEIKRLLRPEGKFAKVSMIWLPFEDKLAGTTEEIILKYNPNWTGAHHTRMPLAVSEWAAGHFVPETLHTFDALIPFTRDKFRGRMRACRGMGASSIPKEKKEQFDKELEIYLRENTPEEFTVLHQIWVEVYKVAKNCG